MKKLFILLLTVMMVISMSSCGKQTNEGALTSKTLSSEAVSTSAVEKTTAESTTSEDTSAREWMEVSIPKLKISGAIIEQAENICFDKNKSNFTVLLLNNKYDGSRPIYPMVIVRDNDSGKLLTYKPIDDYNAYSFHGFFEDVDGDSYPEIIIQICDGMSGGAGGYSQSVLKYSHGKLVNLLKEDFNTGFISVFQNGFKFKVVNKFTGYKKAVTLDKVQREVYFNEDGTVGEECGDSSISCDSFFTFKPIDIDNDGVYEIETMQYSSLYGHTDYIGTACSILKYDNKVKTFKVIKAKFLIKSDMNEFADGWWGK